MLHFCSSVLYFQNSKCKLLQEGCIYRRIYKISHKMSVSLANSKLLKIYGKFTMFLDIDRQFAVHHEGECLTFFHGRNNKVNICVQFL